MVVLLGGRVDRAARLRRDHHRRLGRPAQGPRDQPLDGHRVRHGHRAHVEAAAAGRLLDVRRHPPAGGRGAAVHRRPGPPRARSAGEREQRRCSRPSPHACWRTRCSSATTSSGSSPITAATVTPARRSRSHRARSRRPATAAPIAAADSYEAGTTPVARASKLLRPCSERIDHIGVAVEDLDEAIGSTASGSACPSSTARRSRSSGRRGGPAGGRRAPRRAARAARPGHGVGKFLERSGPGLHHVAYADRRHRRRPGAVRGAGLRLIDEQPRTGIREQPRGVSHPEVDRRGAHRARRSPRRATDG